jgi:hypothetical protein
MWGHGASYKAQGSDEVSRWLDKISLVAWVQIFSLHAFAFVNSHGAGNQAIFFFGDRCCSCIANQSEIAQAVFKAVKAN